MFWSYNVTSSQLESLLDEADVQLSQVLEQEDVLQECKSNNQKLIPYLCKTEVLSEVIRLIITDPPSNLEPAERFKLPNVAAEILTCEVPAINEKISSDEALLSQLYSFIEDGETPLNPLLSSFFSKAFGALITRKKEQNWYNYQFSCLQVIEFLKKKDLVTDVLRNIGTSAISDLIICLITSIEGPDMRQNVLDWLKEKKLIESIIELLDPSQDRDTHDNAARLFNEIQRACKEGQHLPPNERCDDPLLKTIEDPSTVELVLEVMFRTSPDCGDLNESSLLSGLVILQNFLDTQNRPIIDALTLEPSPISQPNLMMSRMIHTNPDPLTPEELEQLKQLVKATVDAIVPKIGEFSRLLANPPKRPEVRTTAGVLDPPLGPVRLSVAKFMSGLLSTYHLEVNKAMIECRTIDILLDLFFKYSLNNFLHREVEQCLSHIFSWNPNQKFPTQKVECEEKEIMEEEPKNEQQPENSQAQEQHPYDNPLLAHLFTSCRLVERVLDAWDENDSDEKRAAEQAGDDPNAVSSSGRNRKGYMGHLTKIANILVQSSPDNSSSETSPSATTNTEASSSSKSSSIAIPSSALTIVSSEMGKLPSATTEQWSSFVSGSLAATNARNVVTPARTFSGGNMSSSEDELDNSYMHDATVQQLFADYQMQQMSEHFIDSFGFDEDPHDDDISKMPTHPKLSKVDFDDNDEIGGAPSTSGQENDSEQPKKTPEELFEEQCNQKMSLATGNDDGSEDDLWANRTKEISFGPNATNASSQANHSDPNDSSSDEEELSSSAEEGKRMEIDLGLADEERKRKEKEDSEKQTDTAWPPPSAASEAETPPIAMDTGNPWGETSANTTQESEGVPTSSTPPDGGWANFGDSGLEEEAKEGGWVADFEAQEQAKSGEEKAQNEEEMTS